MEINLASKKARVFAVFATVILSFIFMDLPTILGIVLFVLASYSYYFGYVTTLAIYKDLTKKEGETVDFTNAQVGIFIVLAIIGLISLIIFSKMQVVTLFTKFLTMGFVYNLFLLVAIIIINMFTSD